MSSNAAKDHLIKLVLNALFPEVEVPELNQKKTLEQAIAAYRKRDEYKIEKQWLKLFPDAPVKHELHNVPHYAFQGDEMRGELRIKVGKRKDYSDEYGAVVEFNIPLNELMGLPEPMQQAFQEKYDTDQERAKLRQRLSALTPKQLFEAFEVDPKEFALKGLTPAQLESIRNAMA